MKNESILKTAEQIAKKFTALTGFTCQINESHVAHTLRGPKEFVTISFKPRGRGRGWFQLGSCDKKGTWDIMDTDEVNGEKAMKKLVPRGATDVKYEEETVGGHLLCSLSFKIKTDGRKS